jgi:D-beta-D-heptose 7-phosphate kinase / D-beta-D-heptose 1-phosphate adenosyltransferase
VVGLQSPPAAATQPEAARAAMLASLASVDLVTTFVDASLDALIANLRPDVIVRSAPAASNVPTPASPT